MSRYIDATDIAKQIADFKKSITSPNSDYMTGYICALSVTEGMIANAMIASTADVVEVVRCKDCMYWTGKDYDGCCIKNGLATRYAKDYCSYGERREDNERLQELIKEVQGYNEEWVKNNSRLRR